MNHKPAESVQDEKQANPGKSFNISQCKQNHKMLYSSIREIKNVSPQCLQKQLKFLFNPLIEYK